MKIPDNLNVLEFAMERNIIQMYDEPTRRDNILDLVLTSKSSLVKSSVSVPGIYLIIMVITDMDMKPFYSNPKRRTLYKFQKADCAKIKSNC